MDDFFLVAVPVISEELKGDNRPVQGVLFEAYQDRQRPKAARYAEPTLMDYLADNPREGDHASPHGAQTEALGPVPL